MHNSRILRLISAAGILVMIVFSIIASKWLLAEAYHYQARAFMDSWNPNQDIPKGEWEIVHDALTKSIKLNSTQATYYEDMSELMFLKTFESSLNPLEHAFLQKQALEHIRQAVNLRPSWPYAWAQFALIKYRLYELDKEVSLALEKAIVLGPWESSVQMIVAEVSFSCWKNLDHALTEKILKQFERTSQSEIAKVFDIAKKYNMTAPLCQKLINKPTPAKLCPK